MKGISIFNLFLAGILTIFISCNQEDAFECVKSTGKIVVQERVVLPFDEIVVEDNIEVHLTNQANTLLTVEGGQNVINKIITTSSGNTLFISNHNKCNWVRSYAKPMKVTIGARQDYLGITHKGYGAILSKDVLSVAALNIASMDGGGNIHLNVNSQSVYVYSNSAAHITLTGYTDKATFWLHRAIGRVSAEELQAKVCMTTHGGTNEIRVFPVEELHVKIYERGTVAYYNQPAKLVSKIAGGGKLIKRQ